VACMLYKMVILFHVNVDFFFVWHNLFREKKGDHQTEIHITLLNGDYLRPTVCHFLGSYVLYCWLHN
jgi:hypothetical protein